MRNARERRDAKGGSTRIAMTVKCEELQTSKARRKTRAADRSQDARSIRRLPFAADPALFWGV